jgi:EF-hand domain pair
VKRLSDPRNMVATQRQDKTASSPSKNSRAPTKRRGVWFFHRAAPVSPVAAVPPRTAESMGGNQNQHTPKISNTATVPRGASIPPPPVLAPPPTPPLPRPHWVCRTRYFQTLCDQAFRLIDSDGSGAVDEKELYTGLLLIHLQLGMYAGPAACKPLSRDRASALFRKMDRDGSGTLQRHEFAHGMAVLFGNVILRVMVQWALTLLIVPGLAQFLVQSVLLRTARGVYSVITNLDEHSRFFQWIELTLEGLAEYIYETLLPAWFIAASLWIGRMLAAVPAAVWTILPITVVSTLLGMLVVPYCIYQVDDFFQRMADRHARKVK